MILREKNLFYKCLLSQTCVCFSMVNESSEKEEALSFEELQVVRDAMNMDISQIITPKDLESLGTEAASKKYFLDEPINSSSKALLSIKLDQFSQKVFEDELCSNVACGNDDSVMNETRNIIRKLSFIAENFDRLRQVINLETN